MEGGEKKNGRAWVRPRRAGAELCDAGCAEKEKEVRVTQGGLRAGCVTHFLLARGAVI